MLFGEELHQREELGAVDCEAGGAVLAGSRREVVPHTEEEREFANRRGCAEQVLCVQLARFLACRALFNGS
eukprot:1587579-Rhodomonas_salina.1